MPRVAISGATGTLGRAVSDRFIDWRQSLGDSRIDVTSEIAVRKWFATLERVDAAVTCAGVSLVKPALEMTADEWRRVLDVNLTGTFLVAREAVRHGARRIVTIGSIHGCTPTSYPERVAYTASKGGVKALTEALAVEWGPMGVAVNCICPGHLPTLMPGAMAGMDLLHAARTKTPTGKLTTPEEVAEVVYWLCNDAPLSFTGQTITIDGSFTMNTFPLR